jgi:hypothetical protein
MKINELLEISKKELVEPETIRQLFPNISEEEFNKLEAIITIKTSNYPFENMYAFENTVRALNDIIPRIDMMEGAEPSWIWYTCNIMQKLRPNMELEKEIIEYIIKIFTDNGIYFLHPYIIENNKENLDTRWADIYKAAKYKADTGPFPIEATSLLNRQAIELMKMELYSKTKESK